MSERVVGLLVYDGIQTLDAVGPAEVFATAAKLRGGGCYRLLVCSPTGEPVRTDSGLSLGADVALLDLDADVDTLIVAGGLGSWEATQDRAVLDGVRWVAANARRVCSVCTGAFLLASAGLLAGRTVTTHWASCRYLAEQYPDITVEPNRIFVRDGTVFTSAGVTAGIDLALALVEADHGVELAREVARWLVVFLQRPGGQSQYSARLEAPVPATSPLRPVVDAIAAEPAADHRMSRLAQRAQVSERHLTRLFAEQAGTTPARFVERTRVEVARELLERTDLPVHAVATRSGFGSEETMRRAFLRVLGVGPAGYRARFQCTPQLMEA